MADFNVTFENTQSMNVDFSQDSFACDFGVEIPEGNYTGSYEVTPSDTEQMLFTNGKTLEGNITIHPIPSNYGLITWDGSNLTVS